MQVFRKSLTFRIALPVVVMSILLGISLYFIVLKTVSDFAENEIQRDLNSLSRRIYNVCNINFENLLMSGQANDPEEFIIRQGMTLGQIEDFLNLEALNGYVYDLQDKRLLLKTHLPKAAQKIMTDLTEKNKMISLGIENQSYFAYHFDFSPWNWQITIIKNQKEYAALINKVKHVHLYTMVIVLLISTLLILFIYQSIKGPINLIIKPLQKGEKPDYKGMDAFEFLSRTIAGMMDSIQQNEEKYRALVETTNDFVWEVDHDGKYTYASPSILHILGYVPEEVIGKTPFSLMPPNEAARTKAFFKEKLRSQETFTGLVNMNFHKNGHSVTLETNGVPIFDENGNFRGYRGIDRDISERIRAEKEHLELENQRQQLHKIEAIGTLAGGLAHDFNNLLSVIMGNLSLAEVEVKNGSDITKYLREAEAASRRAGDLASQLITFSKGGTPIKKIGSIGRLIEDVTLEVLKDSNIEPAFEISEDLITVEYDDNQMKHALKNLIVNARESMPEGGKIDIRARNYKLTDQTAHSGLAGTKGDYVKINIRDHGVGIKKEHMHKIFDPYFSTKPMGAQKGTGLGLTISYSIISNHDGMINVNSRPDVGTIVSLYIPAYERPEKPAMLAEPVKIVQDIIRPHRILLMDDEEMIRNLGKRILNKNGYDTELAENGEQAIELFENAIVTGKPFDLVILDLTVKGGMGGAKTITRLREIDPTVKAIVSSGYFSDPVMRDHKNYGFILSLPKPYNKITMKEIVEKAFQGH